MTPDLLSRLDPWPAALHLIGGELVRAGSVRRFSSPMGSPTGTQCALADPVVIADAVASARAAQPAWRAVPVEDRSLILQHAAIRVRESSELRDTIVDCIRAETGKPRAEAEIEVDETMDVLQALAAMAPVVLAPRSNPIDAAVWTDKSSQTLLEPRGVVACIKPWNYPFENPLWSIVPALLAGNTVILKPSEYTPYSAVMAASLIQSCAEIPGLVNVVCGDGRTGARLIAHDGVDFVAFTGSVATGGLVWAACTSRGIQCTLERGGNDAAIVLSDCDVQHAAAGVTWGALTNAGQVCTGVKRVLVERGVYDSFVDALVAEVRRLELDRDIGPLISKRAVRVVLSAAEDARKRGGQILVGGEETGRPGNYVSPIVIGHCPTSARLWSDEVFGPLLPVRSFEGVEEAIETANDSRYGLGASIWSGHIEQARKLALRLDVGTVWINDVNLPLPEAPWPGRKASGPGIELSELALGEYTIPKHILVDRQESPKEWWFPYK